MSTANYDLPDETLQRVKKFSGARTKREAIIIALEDYLRRKKVSDITKAKGQFKLRWSQKSLGDYRG